MKRHVVGLVLCAWTLSLLPAQEAVPARGPAAALPALAQPVAGALVLAGDAPTDAVRDRFLELAGGQKARLAVLASAGADADAALEPWKQRGVASLAPVPASKQAANVPEMLKPVAEATGVWLEGGESDRRSTQEQGSALERELRRLLERGGVVGGPAAGMLGQLVLVHGDPAVRAVPGLGILSGFLVEQPSPATERGGQMLDLLAKHPGHVGLRIAPGTAVVVQGRGLRVVGAAPAFLCLAASAQRPASVRRLKAGDQADLVALSRAAAARAGPPFPPAQPAPARLEGGALVLGGGGRLPEAVRKRFLDLAGGPDALIVVVPTAHADPIPPETAEVKMLRASGARNLRVLHTRSRREADSEAFVAPLREARGIWFSGGRQWRFIDAYEGTAAERAFHEVLRRGGVIGGSSAGASIQSEYMPRGDPLGNLLIMAEGYERGFGFLRGTAVDQHFFARRRQRDMSELVRVYPQLLGIGIDEGTALVVQGAVAEVVGSGKVAMYDRRRPVAGPKDYEELEPGTRYDLVARQRISGAQATGGP